MIVRDSDIMRVAAFPTKTCTPLVVNADAPLPFPIPRQFLESVTSRNAQILDCLCRVDRLKLAPSHVLHMRRERSDPVDRESGQLICARSIGNSEAIGGWLQRRAQFTPG